MTSTETGGAPGAPALGESRPTSTTVHATWRGDRRYEIGRPGGPTVTIDAAGEEGLGPVDFFGDPTGGNALLIFNEELRFPIAWRFRGVGFFDAGNVFPTPGDMSFGQLRAGTGVGLRVVTPFALLRVDVGTPIRPQPGEARLKWFFSIGQSF